ncbi:hypothetical protein SAMN05216259_102597 [Actinacidiphila guanduensis]|uniref:Uncharacterized protein n=1 Tax=Actinacidiphila guanduensis TaxID=310781 RepID=A0A1G9YLA7_9ACTN|nr:hypothetical protein SAMN05216259_102597 [Actinacidiphila guanduensis]
MHQGAPGRAQTSPHCPPRAPTRTTTPTPKGRGGGTSQAKPWGTAREETTGLTTVFNPRWANENPKGALRGTPRRSSGGGTARSTDPGRQPQRARTATAPYPLARREASSRQFSTAHAAVDMPMQGESQRFAVIGYGHAPSTAPPTRPGTCFTERRGGPTAREAFGRRPGRSAVRGDGGGGTPWPAPPRHSRLPGPRADPWRPCKRRRTDRHRAHGRAHGHIYREHTPDRARIAPDAATGRPGRAGPTGGFRPSGTSLLTVGMRRTTLGVPGSHTYARLGCPAHAPHRPQPVHRGG